MSQGAKVVIPRTVLLETLMVGMGRVVLPVTLTMKEGRVVNTVLSTMQVKPGFASGGSFC